MSPFSYITVIIPPVKSISSPFLYVIFVGLFFISIPVISFFTFTVNVAVFPPYVTVIVCSFTSFLLYPVIISFVIFTSLVVVSSYVIVIIPPVKSISSPFRYVVLVGSLFIFIDFTDFPTIVTWQVAVLPPSSVVAVIVAVPSAIAVKTPLFTLTIFTLLLVHVTFLFVAFSGITVAVNVSVVPSFIVVEFLFRLIPVTGIDDASVVVSSSADSVLFSFLSNTSTFIEYVVLGFNPFNSYLLILSSDFVHAISPVSNWVELVLAL